MILVPRFGHASQALLDQSRAARDCRKMTGKMKVSQKPEIGDNRGTAVPTLSLERGRGLG